MLNESEPVYSVGAMAAGGAAALALLVAALPLSSGTKQALLTAVAVGTPLVAAHYAREYVAPLGPNREQAGEGHPLEAQVEAFEPDGGGGPEMAPDPANEFDDGR